MPAWFFVVYFGVLVVGVLVAVVQALLEPKALRAASLYGLFVLVLILVGVWVASGQVAAGETASGVSSLVLGVGIANLRHLSRWRVVNVSPPPTWVVRAFARWLSHLFALAGVLAMGESPDTVYFAIGYVLVVVEEKWRPEV